MRTHGWAGAAPASDEEAVARILAAAGKAIDERGADFSIADVARTLGVTRQTVYRYFPSTEALLMQAGVVAATDFLDRLSTHLQGITDPADAATEAIATALEWLPKDKHIGLLLSPGRTPALTESVTSDIALQCDIGGHGLGQGGRAAGGEQQADVFVLGQPFQRCRDGLGRRVGRVGDALQMGGQPVQEVGGRDDAGLHQQCLGAREVAVHRLAGDAQRAGHVGDGEVRATLVDRLARGSEYPGDGFLVTRRRGAGPPVGSHAENCSELAVGDLQVLDAVDPAGPKTLWLGQFRDVGNLIGDLVEHQLDLHARQVGADAEVCAVAAEIGRAHV